MKPNVTAIGIGRGITIMASELCTLQEPVTSLIVIQQVADAPVHVLEDLALTFTITGPGRLLVLLRTLQACDRIVIDRTAAFCRFKRQGEGSLSPLPSIRLRIP